MTLLLLCSAGTGFSQTLHYGVEVTDMYCPYCLYHHDGYPCEHRYTVSLLDYPIVKKPAKLEPVKKPPVDNPLRIRLEKRMAEIDSTNFVKTNTVPMEIVPGLTPKN
jgi:hypothetical protein